MKHPDARIESLLAKLASPRLAAIDLSLNRVGALLADLGNPQDRLPPVVHVAGTNGKGSLLAYLAAMCKAAGLRAHSYISPHLMRFNERIILAGEEIEDGRLLPLLERVWAHMERHAVTFFEATTAAAFLAFAETPADIVLLETGLGGRLDATNMVRAPLLTAITPVSIDHKEYLGETLAAIAGEKAGIIKRGVPCVIGPQVPEAAQVIEWAAQGLEAPLLRYGHEWDVQAEASGFQYRSDTLDALFPIPGLAGEHQIANAGTAIACLEQLKGFSITVKHMAEGIRQVQWPARLQHLVSGNLAALLPGGSELWLDGGHNPAAGEMLALWVKQQPKPVHLICGMLKTKDAVGFLTPLAPYVRSLAAIAIPDEPQSQTPGQLTEAAKAAGIEEMEIIPIMLDIKNAIDIVVKKAEKEYIILVCGSLYLAGNILWQNNQKP